MFKRKKTEAAGPGSDGAPSPLEVTAEPAPADPRTTCYPRDGDAPPPVVGQPRTTVYRQAVKWNRGGYDTVN